MEKELSKGDRHFYLYAKGHYVRRCTTTELIKIQAHRCAIDEKRLTLRDVNITLTRLAHKHIENTGQFIYFLDQVTTYVNQAGIHLAISRACLDVLMVTKVTEIGFELGEPDPTILPLANDAGDSSK